ncbi:MAG: helical backbone metal receptor [Bacteriovoracia bacterium]
MRVVSLVPSWTETLIECGVDVVGRTRFCVHPPNYIKIVGGTKDLDKILLEELNPDLLILDKEENLPEMANRKNHVTHVEKADDVPAELERLAEILQNPKLARLAQEWTEELAHPYFPQPAAKIPGITAWIKRPEQEPEQILYMIWRGPWMAVAPHAFVGSMLTHLGYGAKLQVQEEKYPKIDLENYDPQKTLLLFASEPYPFAKKKRELQALAFPSAIVDGEAYSWFGVRSLRFLQKLRAL